MKELVRRWTSPTPEFWKRIIKAGFSIGAIGAAIITTQAKFPDLNLPEFFVTASKYCTAIGFFSALLAKFTVDDSKKEGV